MIDKYNAYDDYEDDPDAPLPDDVSEDDQPDTVYDDSDFCPNCYKPLTEAMDSCPYCGDILYRSLKDGPFIPPKGPLARLVAWMIIALVVLATLGLLLVQIVP